MMKIRNLNVLVAMVGLASAVNADTVLQLSNASFEVQNPFTQTAGCAGATLCYNFSIVGWDIHGGTAGTQSPSIGGFTPPAYEGNNVAYLNSASPGGTYITQNLGNLTAGTTYDVSVAVAGRGPVGANTLPVQYRLGAALGSSASPTFTDEHDSPVGIIAPGDLLWRVVTLQFTPDASFGGNWFFFVSNDGAPGSQFAQLNVDAATPEPSSWLLLASALGLIGLFRLRMARA